MLTFIVFLSSSLLLVVQLASAQLSPRIIGVVFRDRVTRFALTLFAFTFTFTLAVLVRIHASVPGLSAHFAAYLCLLSVVVFLFLIDHVGKTLRPSGALQAVARLAHEVLQSVNTLLAALSRTATGPSVAAATIDSPCATPLTTDHRSPITDHWPLSAGHRSLITGHLSLVLLALAVLAATGCAHLGPKTVAVDRFDYSTAIADSWKQQTLLNIVKLRYMDLPVFVDVASVVGGYSMQTGVSVNGTLSSEKAIQGNYASVGGQAIYTDRPTITYVPMTGEKFLRGLITPIDPKNIFFMLQSGYAADFLLGLTVESLNGVRNRSTAGGAVAGGGPGVCPRAAIAARGAGGRRLRDARGGGQGQRLNRRGVLPARRRARPTSRKRRRKSGGCSSCLRSSRNSCSPIRRCAGRTMNWP